LRWGCAILVEETDTKSAGLSGLQPDAGSGVAIVRDLVTAENLGQVLDAIPLALVTIDRNGAIRAFGKRAETMFGYRAEEVIGRNVSLLTPPHIAKKHDHYLAEYARTGERHVIGATRIEMALHKSGHQFPVELRVSEIRLDGEVAYQGFLRPIDGGELQRGEAKAMLADLAQASRVSASQAVQPL
jgi:two-component system, LuxR family, sensor kinase FixL